MKPKETSIMFKKVVKKWTPPAVWDYFVRWLVGVRLVDEWPSLSVGGWPEAANEAAKGFGDGLTSITDGAAIGFFKEGQLFQAAENNRETHDRLVQFAFVVARTALRYGEIRLLDFGGSFGAHVFAIERLLPEIQCEYTVCELPEFCEIGRRLNSHVHFVSGIEQAGEGYHLVYASSSVQYSKDWRKLVADLCRASKANVFITRTPFVFAIPSFVTVQQAYKTEYPGWVFNYQEFTQEFTRHDMILREVFLNGRGIPVRGVNVTNVHLGLWFEKHDA